MSYRINRIGGAAAVVPNLGAPSSRQTSLGARWIPALTVRCLAACAFVIASACGDDEQGLREVPEVPEQVRPDSPDNGGGEGEEKAAPCRELHEATLLVAASAFDGEGSTLAALCGDALVVLGRSDDDDTVPFAASGRAGWLERTKSEVIWLERLDPFETRRVPIQIDGEGANPQAVALAGADAYVASYHFQQLPIVDPTGEGQEAVSSRSVDLQPLFGTLAADAVPAVLGVATFGERVVVPVAVFDAVTYQPSLSQLAVVDPAQGTLVDQDATAEGVQGLALIGDNPWLGLAQDEAGRLIVPTPGFYSELDGFVEAVDEAGETEVLLREADLGAELQAMAWADSKHAFIVAGNRAYAWSPFSSLVADAPFTQSADGLALSQDALFSWSREEGLRRFRLEGCAVDSTCKETTPAAGAWKLDQPIAGVVALDASDG